MNENRIVNELLSSFIDEYTQFNDSFHNIMNEFQNFEMDFDLKGIIERVSNRQAEINALIEGKQKELNFSEISKEVSEKRKETLKKEIASLTEELNGNEELIEKRKKEEESKRLAFRKRINAAIQKMYTDMETHFVDGKEVSKATLLQDEMEHRLEVLNFRIESLRKKLENTSDLTIKNQLWKELSSLLKEGKQVKEIKEQIATFTETYTYIKGKYIDRERVPEAYLDVKDIYRMQEAFELFSNAINPIDWKEDEKTRDVHVSLNVIKNEDGSYSLEMRCANKIIAPMPRLKKNEINAKLIQKLLGGFAFTVSANLPITLNELETRNVDVKIDGIEYGKKDYMEVGQFLEGKLKGIEVTKEETLEEEKTTSEPKVSEEHSEEKKEKNDVPTQPEGTTTEPEAPEATPEEKKEKNDVPAQPEGTTTEPEAPEATPEEKKEKNDVPAQSEGTTTEPETPEATPEGIDLNNGQGQNIPPIDNPQPSTSSNTDEMEKEHEKHLNRVLRARNADRAKSLTYALSACLVATGTAVVSTFTGAGLLVPGTAALVAGVAAAREYIYKPIKEKLSYRHTIKKLKKIAAENDVELDYRPNEGICNFVVPNPDHPEEEPVVICSENAQDPVVDALLEKLNSDVNTVFNVNSSRGKGKEARGYNELIQDDFFPVTVDRLDYAFDIFGGMQTPKEKSRWKLSSIDIKNITKRGKKKKENEEYFSPLEERLSRNEKMNQQRRSASADSATEPENRQEIPEATVPKLEITPQDDRTPEGMSADEILQELEEPNGPEVAPTAQKLSSEEMDTINFMKQLNGAEGLAEEKVEGRNLSDAQVKEYYIGAKAAYNRGNSSENTTGEIELGSYLQRFYENDITLADFEALQELDVEGKFFTDAAKEDLKTRINANGKGLKL